MIEFLIDNNALQEFSLSTDFEKNIDMLKCRQENREIRLNFHRSILIEQIKGADDKHIRKNFEQFITLLSRFKSVSELSFLHGPTFHIRSYIESTSQPITQSEQALWHQIIDVILACENYDDFISWAADVLVCPLTE